MPSYLALSAATVIGAISPMGKVAPSLRTGLMWKDPVASIAALLLANSCCSGSELVPVELASKYGVSCWYCLRVVRNQSSVTFMVPASTWANALSAGMLFITIELISCPALAGSPPGQAIGVRPLDFKVSHRARKPSQSVGTVLTPAAEKASSL